MNVSRLVAVSTAIFLSVSASAHAALPAGIAAFFDGLTADFTDFMNTYMYPIAFVVLSALIILGWLKKARKAAS